MEKKTRQLTWKSPVQGLEIPVKVLGNPCAVYKDFCKNVVKACCYYGAEIAQAFNRKPIMVQYFGWEPHLLTTRRRPSARTSSPVAVENRKGL